MSTRNGNAGMKSMLQAGGAMSDQRRQPCQFSLVSDKGRNQVSQQTTRKLNIFILRSTSLSMMLLLLLMMMMMMMKIMIELVHSQIHQLVEPVDSLHPTQAAQALITEQV